MLDRSRIDTSSLPKAYLNAYPYPAFVLVSPIPLPTINDDVDRDGLPIPPEGHQIPFTRSTHSLIHPFKPIYSNAKWTNLTQGVDFLDCLSVDQARVVGEWISGARAVKRKRESSTTSLQQFSSAGPSDLSKHHRRQARRHLPRYGATPSEVTASFANTTISPRTSFDATDDTPMPDVTPRSAPPGEPPVGFWEPENHPYDDRSSEGIASNADSDTGLEDYHEGEGNGSETLTVQLSGPCSVTLEMTKTSMPVWQISATGSRSQMHTHTFNIITTVPKSKVRYPNQIHRGDEREEQRESVQQTPTALLPVVPPRPKTRILGKRSSPTLGPELTLPQDPSDRIDIEPSAFDITPRDEIMALDLPPPTVLRPLQNSRALVFNKDGTVNRRTHVQKGLSSSGRSMDVHELLMTTDWTKTPLGPMDSWPQSLKTIVCLVMQYPHQCCLWWGPELTLIYNAPYAEVIHKHPDIFGTSGPKAWSEIWNSLGPLSELVLSGTPVYKEDDFLLFKQLPHQGTGTFEVYHTWLWVPVLQEDETFGGLWNATIDSTQKVLAERRLATVREMGERTSIARTMQEFDTAVLDILASNPRDVPFASLYHVEVDQQEKKASPVHFSGRANVLSPQHDEEVKNVTLHLAGQVGVPDKHPSSPTIVKLSLSKRAPRDSRTSLNPFSHGVAGSPTMSIMSGLSSIPRPKLSRSESPSVTSENGSQGASKSYSGTNPTSASKTTTAWPFKEALQTRRLVLVENCSELIEGYDIKVWDELPNAAVVIPIANDSDDGVPTAVMVVGLNIRRPFDDDYESFLHVLRLQLASGLAAARSYEAERQRIDELAALDRAKSLLFSNVSHELRTPLTLVAGPLDDLLAEAQEGPKKQMLVMARRNVRRLTRLVSTLMDVSRLEAGRLKGSFRLVNLGAMTRDLAALFGAAIQKARLEYVIDCDSSPQNVYVDPDHWEKILFNLIGNALKYTMAGFVHVHLHYNATEVILDVKDSGVGIPKSDIGLVGERFHRVQSVSRSYEGTGIGLALIKELIKLHGGVLEIDSHTAEEAADKSHGSTFRVRIPLGSDHLPRDAINMSDAEPASGRVYGQGIVDEAMQWNEDRDTRDSGAGSTMSVLSSGDSGESSSGSRGLDPATLYFRKDDVILLVDDSHDTRRYMRSIFAPYCNLIEARDGQEALKLCESHAPDLIISDVMMPIMDGFGLLSALKSSPKFKIIPVIMLTARGGDEAKVEGLLAGADDYLAKPFNARELVARGSAHMQLQLGKKRRYLEDAFAEQTAEIRALSEYSPGGIFRLDEDMNITFTNTAWHEISGYPTGEVVSDWTRYIATEHREEAEQFWSQILESDAPQHTTEWRFANGRWVQIKIIRLDKAAPGLKGLLGSCTDITERKLHEESQVERMAEEKKRRVEAEEAKRQQELLIDITSHEIRNPISSLMQEQLELAIENKTGFMPTKQLFTTIEEDLEALESIYQCGLTQERISNDVLSLGRIQLDMLQMYDVEVDVRSEAQKVITIFQNEARMKRIEISLNIGESLQKSGVHHIKTDPVRLGQVVTNLLSNGIRFTSNSMIRKIELRYDLSFSPPADEYSCSPPVGDTPPIQLKDDMDVYLYVAVRDTGPGLTPKELNMLFQRFSQVSPKTHTIFGGSGLGLFVCRKITEIMGGRIQVESEHGKGSTFKFYIKARTAQTALQQASYRRKNDSSYDRPLEAGDETINMTKPATKKKPSRYVASGYRPHVLIVEDNLINQTVLMRQLKHVGLTCEVASNGLEALEKIRKVATKTGARQGQMFDCVLMDLEMPVMDGLTALRHIREEERDGLLHLNLVIALTGNARQGQIDAAKAAGMDEVVIKPYRLDDLLHKIEDMVRVRATTLVSP